VKVAKLDAVAVKEYPEFGHELDVFAVEIEGITV
jgi:hypothetical protein